MTPKQRTTLMAHLWPAAAEAQGWDVNDRAVRLTVLGLALKRKIASASEINNTDDYDAVKAYLTAAADSLQGAHEMHNAEPGEARRLRKVIGHWVKCLGLYVEKPEGYLYAIINDKFNRGSKVTKIGLEDLSADVLPGEKHSPLYQVLSSIVRATSAKRKKAGDSDHSMRVKARVPCRGDCSVCGNSRRASGSPDIEAAIAETEPTAEEIAEAFATTTHE